MAAMLFLYSFILLFPLLSNGFIHEKNKRRLLHHHHYHHHHSFDQSSLFRSSPTVLSLSHSEDDDASNSYDEEDMTSSSGPRRRRPTRVRPVRPTAATQKMETRREEAKARHKEALQDPTLLTLEKFSDRRDIHPATKRAITEVLGLQAMTEIQAKTYAAVIAGQSVLGRARTGTGKTLAFLIPAVERLLEADLDLYKPGRTIGVIVIAPTRELAIQIAVQTDALLTFHHDMDVACIYGGTKIQRDLRLLTGPRMPSILVTTPGRLLEHLENDTRLGRRSFCRVAEETRMIVLDEADRLLDGFSKETMKILSFLPRVEKRQNLLFSATISNKLRGFLKGSMKIDFTEVNCVDGSDIQSETNARVNQTYLMLDEISQYIQTLVSILTQVMKEDNYKVLVFFPASKVVRFLANFFNEGLGVSVLEIHSRMSQSSRNRASNAFRSARRGILFSSDVSARGVDYPGVTLVVQYGAPSTQDAYIHRLGRTGRAGQEGKGLLVLMPFEKRSLNYARKRGVRLDEAACDLLEGLSEQAQNIEQARLRIRSGHSLLTPSAESAYRAFLAYYIANSDGLEPSRVVDCAKEFAFSTGLSELPSIESKIALRLGIDGLVEENL